MPDEQDGGEAMHRRRRPRSRWRAHRRNRRIAVSSLLLIGAAALGAEATRSTDPTASAVVVIAGRDLTSGSVLAIDDVAVASIPRGSPLAAAALSPEQVIGRTTVGDLRSGEMITASRVRGEDATRPGYATMPVTFDDPQITAFLVPGMRLDIVWTPDDFTTRAPRVVAEDVGVLRVEPPAGSGDRAFSGGSVSVLLEVRRADTVGLAGAMSSGSLKVLVRDSR